jgi:hypothetical protein
MSLPSFKINVPCGLDEVVLKDIIKKCEHVTDSNGECAEPPDIFAWFFYTYSGCTQEIVASVMKLQIFSSAR